MRWSLIWGYGIAAIWTGIAIAGLIHRVTAQNTLRVPGQYATIQAAIQAAQTNDTILVAPGRYVGNVYINKDITLKSSGGAFATTLDGGGSGIVVSVDCLINVVVDGFTITNGSRGVGLTLCGNGAIRNNRIIGNRGVFAGGGIHTGGGGYDIVGNYIANNTAREGAGIYGGQSGGWAQIYHNVITGNRASLDGGGINMNAGNLGVNVYENTITGNTAGRDGGGIYYEPWNCDVDNNMVIGNTAGRYGGGVYRGGGWTKSTLSHCTVAFNQAQVAGGGLATTGGPIHYVDDTIFWGNSAPVGRQIRLGDPAPLWSVLNIDHCIVEGGPGGVQVVSPLSTLNWGANMLTSDPRFVDPTTNDCHLRVTSPAIGRAGGAPFTLDFEGDARAGTRDIGADELATRLYVAGTPRAGQPFALRVIGQPAAPTFFAIAPRSGRRPNPLMLPGITGSFVVPDPFVVVPAGQVAVGGFLSVPLSLPASFPTPTPFVVQALTGTQLTNAIDVWIW